jgi:predicted RNase H-like HicB family nuclease
MTLGRTAHRTIHAFIRRGDRKYVAECVEIAVVTQGDDLDETVANLQEAVGLHLEGEDLAELDLADDPVLSVTLEVEPVFA